MAVVGFNLQKISIERKKSLKGQVNIKTNLRFTDIKEDRVLPEISKDKTMLRFEFEFTINYEPEIASVFFSGYVLDIESEEEAKNILKEWKNKKIKDDLRLRISNVIWAKCNIKAFLLEEEIGLPIHIPLPRLTK